MGRAELTELTNMCMLRSEDGRYLLQNRIDPNWPGLVFPGGHVEPHESVTDSVVREVWEETGIRILDPRLCGIKHFYNYHGNRYIVFLFTATRWSGELHSSSEGEVMWLTMEEIHQRKCVQGFDDLLRVFTDASLNEVIYTDTTDGEEIRFL